MEHNWNIGEKESKGLKKETEYAVLVGLIQRNQTEEQVTDYLDELEFLALTAGILTVVATRLGWDEESAEAVTVASSPAAPAAACPRKTTRSR